MWKCAVLKVPFVFLLSCCCPLWRAPFADLVPMFICSLVSRQILDWVKLQSPLPSSFLHYSWDCSMKTCRKGALFYFHIITTLCLNTFWHTISTSFYIFYTWDNKSSWTNIFCHFGGKFCSSSFGKLHKLLGLVNQCLAGLGHCFQKHTGCCCWQGVSLCQ